MRGDMEARVLVYLKPQKDQSDQFEHRKIVRFQSFCDSLFYTSRHLKSYP